MISSMGFRKQFVKNIAVFTVTLAAGMSSAHAYLLDTKIGSANLVNSSNASELTAIRNLTGIQTLTLDSKIDITGSNTPALNPGTTDQYFIDVGTRTPGYFLLKFGTGNTGADDTFFFRNVDELTKLVFSSQQVSGLTSGGNIGRLSHYDVFGGGTTTGGGGGSAAVPEPATMALVGLGLLGFAASRRKRKN